jgi:hypothetical protein
MVDISLGQWVSRVQAALDDAKGGGDLPALQARRTTGIAAKIPPTTKN